jgi:hypothetical protein
MQYLVPTLVVLHVLPGAFWFGATGVLARLGARGASLDLRLPQAGAAGIAILGGLALWFVQHRNLVGASAELLTAGAAGAILAAIFQQALAWPAASKGTDTGTVRFAWAQRISLALLALALAAMLLARYV